MSSLYIIHPPVINAASLLMPARALSAYAAAAIILSSRHGLDAGNVTAHAWRARGSEIPFFRVAS